MNIPPKLGRPINQSKLGRSSLEIKNISNINSKKFIASRTFVAYFIPFICLLASCTLGVISINTIITLDSPIFYSMLYFTAFAAILASPKIFKITISVALYSLLPMQLLSLYSSISGQTENILSYLMVFVTGLTFYLPIYFLGIFKIWVTKKLVLTQEYIQIDDKKINYENITAKSFYISKSSKPLLRKKIIIQANNTDYEIQTEMWLDMPKIHALLNFYTPKITSSIEDSDLTL